MKALEPYIRVCLLGAVVLAVLIFAGAGAERRSVVLGAPDGIPDQGLLAMQTNEKLDQVNANLEQLNGKLQAILDLLKSGNVTVVVKDGGAPAGK